MMTLNFVGDISFNDEGKSKVLDFSSFSQLNSDSDFTVANLEAIISKGDFNPLKNPRVTTCEKALNQLKTLNIALVTLAHNHIFDAKFSGFEATLSKLKNLDIPYIGAGLTKDEAEKPYILSQGDLKIGFLNYICADTNPSLPPNCEVFLNRYDPVKVVVDIANLKKRCHHVILLLHWGGKYEGGYFPARNQISEAKSFQNAGASLIVGHHPHTLQPGLLYKNKPVYFSLGNFVFFDVCHEGKTIKLSPRRKKGGLLKVKLSETMIVDQKLYFTEILHNKIRVNKYNFNYSIRNFFFKRLESNPLFWKLYLFQFKFINPLFYFLFVQEGGYSKFQNLNFEKAKHYLWKK